MEYTPGQVDDASTQAELLKLAQVVNIAEMKALKLATREPARPVDLQVVVCDGTNWNPMGDGLKRPIWYDADVQLWKAFL